MFGHEERNDSTQAIERVLFMHSSHNFSVLFCQEGGFYLSMVGQWSVSCNKCNQDHPIFLSLAQSQHLLFRQAYSM